MCIILNSRASTLLVLRQESPALAFIRSGFPSIYLLPLGPRPFLRGFVLPSLCDALLFLLFLSGMSGWTECTIDDKGVFSILSQTSSKSHYSYDSVGPMGLQFTPGVNNRNETQGVMPGTWTLFNLMGYKHRCDMKASSTIFNVKDDSTGANTLMHAVVNATNYKDIYLSAMSYEKTALVESELPFRLNPYISGDNYLDLGYANGNLYVFGDALYSTSIYSPSVTVIRTMTTVPIRSTSTYIPSNGTYPTLNITASTFLGCDGITSYNNANMGKDLVTSCWNPRDDQAHFFYYDGTSIRELGSSGNTDSLELKSKVPLGNSTSFEIFMIPNDVTGLNSMRLINDGTPHRNITRTTAASVMITDTFSLKLPSSTSTLRSGAGGDSDSGSGSSGGGLGAGAIIGILAAVLVAMGGLVVMVRRKKTKAQGASVAQTQVRPQPLEGATHEIKNSTGVDGNYLITSSQGPALSTGQSSFMQQQQMYPAQSYQTPQQQFVFSTHPRPTVAAVMDPSDAIQQQLQQQQGYSQTPQVWHSQPSVPLNQVPTLQESSSSSISPDTLNHPLPPIPPRP